MASSRILIGIPCQMTGGFRGFDMALSELMRQRTDATVFWSVTGVLPGARNRIVRKALAEDFEYVWMLDDDQPFHPGTAKQPSDLDRLLAHHLEAVVPLSPRRGSPFLPLVYDYLDDDIGVAHQRYLLDSEHGLIRIAGAGMAGLLIKTECFRKIGPDGWFDFYHPPGNFDDYAEDFPFYRRLAEAGVQLYCDLDVQFGHALSSTVAYIMKQDGIWVTVFADNGPFAAIPQPSHPLGMERPRPRTKVVA